MADVVDLPRVFSSPPTPGRPDNGHGLWSQCVATLRDFCPHSYCLSDLFPKPILRVRISFCSLPAHCCLQPSMIRRQQICSTHFKLLSHKLVSNLQKSIADEKTKRCCFIIRPVINRFLQALVWSLYQFYYLSSKL